MNQNDNLPILPSALTGAPLPPPRVESYEIEKLPKAERQMQCMRLSASMAKLHEKAHDPDNGEEGMVAARALGEICLNNWENIIWALRVAAGARKP